MRSTKIMSEIEVIGGNESLNGMSIERMADIMRRRRERGNSDASMLPEIETVRDRQLENCSEVVVNNSVNMIITDTSNRRRGGFVR
jgi:hypothetical protein